MESFIILEDIVFNINCYSYDDALTRIRDIMREESLPVSNLIPLISYCSNFRIKNISIYKHLLQDLIKEKTNVYLTKQDYLMSLLIQDIPNLVTDENGFIISNEYSQSLNNDIEQLILNDNAEGLLPFVSEELPRAHGNRILELCALAASENCFGLVEEYINPNRLNNRLMTCAYIGGSQNIIDLLHSKWSNLSIDINHFFDYAFKAHNYYLLPDDYEYDLTTSCISFSTLGLAKCSEQKINSCYQTVYNKKMPMYYFLLSMRGEEYIKKCNNIDEFVKLCLLHDREHALMIMNQLPAFSKDFSFKWEHNSCYCNSILKMLFNIEEIQIVNFLENEKPTNCEYQLAIIQYLIQTQKENITTEYFRYSTELESGLKFGKMHDTAEQFAYIFKNCLVIQNLFSIINQEYKLCYYKKDNVPTVDIVSASENNDEICISNDGYSKFISNDDLGLDYVCEEPYFGKYFSINYVKKLSKYIMIRYNNFTKNANNFNFINTHLVFIGGTSFRQLHYIYYSSIH